MIYFDNAATTIPKEEILETFFTVTKKFPANPNAMHDLGREARSLIRASEEQVANLFSVKPSEVIFTSCASESNNLAIQGILKSYPQRKKYLVTTPLEHASLSAQMEQLKKEGVQVSYLKLQKNGQIDLTDLEEKLKEEPLLVSIHHINSETGVIQEVEKIGKIIQKYPKTFFHVDGTQSVGKFPISLENIDLFTCSAHKFFGLKGSACLIKKEKILLTPLILGGKSQSIYRAGTPSVGNIASFAKALRLSQENLEEKYQHVKKLEQRLLKGLLQMKEVVINHQEGWSPYIVNFSVPSIKSETLLHALSQKQIYLSTKTACSKEGASEALLALGKEKEVALHSLRVSFSYLNEEKEVDQFLKILKEEIDVFNLKKGAS